MAFILKTIVVALTITFVRCRGDYTADAGSQKLVACLRRRSVPISAISTPLETVNIRLVYTPAVVVQPTTAQHISDAVICASRTETKVQALSGGHSYGSYSTGGKNGSLVVDLQTLQEISVDNATGIAKVGAGVQIGNLALGLFDQGKRAVPHDVVLANGSYVCATPTSYPEIYYALRGAADSFGIVTTFHLQTQAAPTTLTNVRIVIPAALDSKERATDAFLHLQQFALNASALDRRFAFGLRLNQTYFGIEGVFFGRRDEFYQQIAPELLRGLPTPDPVATNVSDLAWLDSLVDQGGPLQVPIGPNPLHAVVYSKSLVTQQARPLTRAAMDAFFDYVLHQGRSSPVPWYSIINLYGGVDSQINVPSVSFAAYAHRASLWVFENIAYSFSHQVFGPAELGFVDGLNRAVTDAQPDGDFAGYSNYLDPRLSAAEAHRVYYGDRLYRTLLAIKRRVDPRATFWNPQAIGVE
ncbi:MAG: hypothetical protein M1826_000115 [Phylliscum demangeonii]|nr:MAG: hypothetical protein M1826_000115 [Phylliscum demangeonii]